MAGEVSVSLDAKQFRDLGALLAKLKDRAKREVVGKLINPVHYSVYIELGTDRIAGGAVKEWEAGDPLVTQWPAKAATNAKTEAMPPMRGSFQEHHQWFMDKLHRLLDGPKKGADIDARRVMIQLVEGWKRFAARITPVEFGTLRQSWITRVEAK